MPSLELTHEEYEQAPLYFTIFITSLLQNRSYTAHHKRGIFYQNDVKRVKTPVYILTRIR